MMAAENENTPSEYQYGTDLRTLTLHFSLYSIFIT